MYLRSTILSLLIVANMGAIDKCVFALGAAEFAVVGPVCCWLAKEAQKISHDSISNYCEIKREFKNKGVKVKKRYIKNIGIKMPDRIKKYPDNCSEKDKEVIDKQLDDLKTAYRKAFGYSVGGILGASVGAAASLVGLVTMVLACNT